MTIVKKILNKVFYALADLVVCMGVGLALEVSGAMAWQPLARLMTTIQGVIHVTPGWVAMGFATFLVTIPFVGYKLTK